MAFLAVGAGSAVHNRPCPGLFTPPEGCTGLLTVQSRGCRVSNHYNCAADAPGDQWRADFDQEGIFFVSRIDCEAQWVESYDMFPTVRQTLDPDARRSGVVQRTAGQRDGHLRLRADRGYGRAEPA